MKNIKNKLFKKLKEKRSKIISMIILSLTLFDKDKVRLFNFLTIINKKSISQLIKGVIFERTVICVINVTEN